MIWVRLLKVLLFLHVFLLIKNVFIILILHQIFIVSKQNKMVEQNPTTDQQPPVVFDEELKREPHHKDAKEGTSFLQVQLQYEAAIREAISILICNYSSLNMAIELGFAGRKQIASD